MDLIKDKWNKNDIECFLSYLESLKIEDKINWTTNIVCTKRKVLAIKTVTLRNIANKIALGNYLSFLDFMLDTYHENTIINALLISKIKDYKTFKKYLDKFSMTIDSWASCDILSFNIKGNYSSYLELVNDYVHDDIMMRRRIAIICLFAFLKNEEYLDDVYFFVDLFFDEKEYYVNMALSWLLCESFIKHRDLSIMYFKKAHLSDFVIKKTISKCKDSYRVSDQDKKNMLSFF